MTLPSGRVTKLFGMSLFFPFYLNYKSQFPLSLPEKMGFFFSPPCKKSKFSSGFALMDFQLPSVFTELSWQLARMYVGSDTKSTTQQ